MSGSRMVFLILALLTCGIQAYADDEISKIDVCREFSLIAKDVMAARQKSRPMSETLPQAIERVKAWAEKYVLELDSKKAEEMAAALVLPAYLNEEYPSSSTFDESRQRQISEFENFHFAE